MTDRARRVLFIMREPLLQDLGGSTTYALAVLRQFLGAGCDVQIVVTLAHSRSARPWFRSRIAPPAGASYAAPGYRKFGSWYLRPWAARAWARMVVRASARYAVLRPLAALVRWAYGQRIFDGPWDLTGPTAAEVATAEQAVKAYDPGVVIVNYAFWSPLLASLTLQGRRSVILMHDVLSARVARMLAAGMPLDCPAIDEATEIAWLRRADVLLAAQESEAAFVRQHVAGNVLVPPVVFDASTTPVSPQPHRCLFVGSKIGPNFDGLQWFLAEVWPRVRQQVPGASLGIAGTICQWITGPPAGVDLLHFVPSLAEEYGRAAVCVVPLLVGSGVKIKLLEALAHGKAVVSTPVGVQGLEHGAGTALAVAGDAEGFASAVIRLLCDPAERTRLEHGARRFTADELAADSPQNQAFVERVLGAAAVSVSSIHEL